MAQHLVDYTQTYSAAQTDVDFPIASDPSVTAFNSHLVYPIPFKILWAYAMALLLQRVRISSPKLKPISRPLIRPIEQAASPSSRPQFCELFRNPIGLNAMEELQLLYTTTTAVAERGHVLVSVGDNYKNIYQGDTYTIRATTNFTTVANTWTSGSLTLDDTLLTGRYQVIGMDIVQATLVGARLIFPGVPIPGYPVPVRPGVIGTVSLGSQGTRYFRYGVQGSFGEFESLALPQIECMNTAAVANPECYLDVVLMRSGVRAA